MKASFATVAMTSVDVNCAYPAVKAEMISFVTSLCFSRSFHTPVSGAFVVNAVSLVEVVVHLPHECSFLLLGNEMVLSRASIELQTIS